MAFVDEDVIAVPPDRFEIPEDMLEAAAWARGIKDSKVASTTVDQIDDVASHLAIRRGGEPVAYVFCRNVNRDEGLDAFRAAVCGFGADEVDILFDAHYADKRWHDAKGRPPDPHELQHACDIDGACTLGLITDCINLMRAKRDSDRLALVSLCYHINKSARQVHWQPETPVLIEDERRGLKGIVPREMRAAFTLPTLWDFVQDRQPDADRFSADLDATRLLTGLGFGVALNTRSDEQRAQLEEVLGRKKNVRLMDQDGTDIDLDTDQEPDEFDSLITMVRDVQERRRERVHRAELAKAASLRAARGEGPAENREERRRREREERRARGRR